MNQPILYQALFGLMTVFFLVAIYFFAKTWRWFHVVCVVFVFGASLFLVRSSAAVYRTVSVWRSAYAKAAPQLERLQTENYELRYGKVDDAEQVVDSMRLLQSKLGRVTLDAGRVWRNCTPAPQQADGSITVSTAPPAPPALPADPAAAGGAGPAAPAAPAAPPPTAIQDQTILYVFLEDVPPPEAGAPPGKKVPYYYLGDFVTVAATNNSVTVRPLSPLSAFDSALVRNPQNTWTMYDTMPIDGHAWFAKDPEAKPNWNRPANEKPVFGEIDETAIRATLTWPRFLPQTFQGPNAANEFQTATQQVTAGVDEYLRDGKSVANKDEFAPRLVWSKVTFVKAHKEPVDSGAKVSPFSPGVTDDFFDRGMAEVAILQLGGDAEFKQGDVAIFPQEDAQRLIDAGICKFEEYVYVRQLNDYAYLFRNFNLRFDAINDDTEQLQRDLAELQRALANVNVQIATANDEQSKLQQDLAKTRFEVEKVTAYLAQLETAWSDTKTRLSSLYRTNHELEEELQRRNQELTEEINRRTVQAVAER